MKKIFRLLKREGTTDQALSKLFFLRLSCRLQGIPVHRNCKKIVVMCHFKNRTFFKKEMIMCKSKSKIVFISKKTLIQSKY